MSIEELTKRVTELELKLAYKTKKLQNIMSVIESLHDTMLYNVEIDNWSSGVEGTTLKTGFDLKTLMDVSDFEPGQLPKPVLKVLYNNACSCCRWCALGDECDCDSHNASLESVDYPGGVLPFDMLPERNRKVENILSEIQVGGFGYCDYSFEKIDVVSGDFFRDIIESIEDEL